MLQNYLKIALRNILKNKAYSLINIFGLAFGVAAVVLIALYMKFELSYDLFHSNIDDLYRVSIVRAEKDAVEGDSPEFVAPLAEAMYNEFPEVKSYSRVSTIRPVYFYTEDQPFKVQKTRYADSTFFDMFSFNLLHGNPADVLCSPFSVVLTESLSKKLFGSSESIGKTVSLDSRTDYLITGIVEDPPVNSQIQFEALISFATLYAEPGHYMDWNGGNQYIHFVTLNKNTKPESVNGKFESFMWDKTNKRLSAYGIKYLPYLQKFKDVHLNHNSYSASLKQSLFIAAGIALFILLIACVNFINLSIANATKRAKEVGMRKVLGADRKRIIKQFLAESFSLTLVAIIIALIIVEAIFPSFQNFVGKDVASLNLLDHAQVLILLGILILVGLLAGSYPALFMTSYQPVKILKGAFANSPGKLTLRNALIVFQFTVSVALIICTMIVNDQISYIKNAELGYEKENVLLIGLPTTEAKESVELLKTEFSKLPFVNNIAASSNVPANGFTSNGYIPEGFESPMMFYALDIDENFLETYGIDLIDGSNFSRKMNIDDSGYLINEALAKKLGWENPIGKTIVRNGEHKVIGVVKDFNFASLHNNIDPLIITNQPWRNRFNILSLSITTSNVSEALEQINLVWKSVAPNSNFEFQFLDDVFNNVYKAEQRFAEVFLTFSLLAIIIAILGLFALTSFTIRQKVKEIGLRKVLGASANEIVYDFSKAYLKIITVAVIIAWSIAFYGMDKWINSFAYNEGISFMPFVASALIALILTFTIIYFVSIKTALRNPVEALKYE